MALKIKKINERELVVSLAIIAGRAVKFDNRASKGPSPSATLFHADFMRKALEHSANDLVHLHKIVDHPQLRLFRALGSSVKAFEAVCEKVPAELIDTPLDKAITQACGDEGLPHILNFSQSFHFTPLQICASRDMWRQAGILMERGANANLFNSGVTAVGLAAYLGHARTLAQMGAFGADIRLELSPEHAPSPNTIGSTLLHRISGRRIENVGCIAEILAHCERCFPTPLPLNAAGESPLDIAKDSHEYSELSAVLLGIASKRDKISIAKACTAPAGSYALTQKPRL